MNLLPRLSTTKPHFSDAMSWILTSNIRLSVGIVSGRRLLLFAAYHLISTRKNIVFMATDMSSALDKIPKKQPGLLIATPDLEDGGCGITVVNHAHQLQNNLCSILIIDPIRADMESAYRSKATGVIAEQEIFAEGNHQDDLIMTLARGKTYRSPLLRASIANQQTLSRNSAERNHLPYNLTARERDVAEMLIQGCNEKTAAEKLGIGYNTVRTHSRSLRRKLSVSNRNQLMLKLLACVPQEHKQAP
jgi:DNA-binding NarL/FixJ family response regulator